MTTTLNKLTHVALVLDASPSMRDLAPTVIKVADEQVQFLAKRSQELNQETRITLYMFSDKDKIRCLYYDMDVLRMPSLAGLYQVEGSSTALIDATVKSQEDLRRTATLYGDHLFLTFVLTDGIENSSRNQPDALQKLLTGQKDNEIVAVLVPNQRQLLVAMGYGFPKGSISVWDTTSAGGLEDAGATIRQATDNVMRSYANNSSMATGQMSKSGGVFNMSADAINYKTVKGLQEVTKAQVIPVKVQGVDIRGFIEGRGETFRQGHYYFPFVKREKVGPQKAVVLRHKVSGKIFGGPQVRTMLNLPDHEISLSPQPNPEYDVFIQSTSTNRKLIQGHDLLVIE